MIPADLCRRQTSFRSIDDPALDAGSAGSGDVLAHVIVTVIGDVAFGRENFFSGSSLWVNVHHCGAEREREMVERLLTVIIKGSKVSPPRDGTNCYCVPHSPSTRWSCSS